MSVWAVVAAAGAGTRMGTQHSKTFLPVGGVPAICRAVAALRSACDGIVLAVQPDEQPEFERVLASCGQRADGYAPGGSTRQQSVRSALQCLPRDCQVVLVHDGARPLASTELIRRIVSETMAHGSAIPALPVTDTIKQVADTGDVTTLDRQCLRAVQTPQGFLLERLRAAYERAGERQFTDDAAVMEHAGMPVHLVEGEPGNIKLTTQMDVRRAEAMLGMGASRAGIGFDVHRLAEGRPLVLCGVRIPFERGLLGHSDADVGAHAVIDALLGAAALGDVGTHFPDTDDRYLGADSLRLLRDAVRLLHENGCRPGNADVTIVAQRPRLQPYVQDMRARLSQAMGIPASCVSVKAKTTEGLGFEGAGEGISAYAVASVVRAVV